MGQILKSRYDVNEMSKNVDFIHSETREIENLSTLLEYLLKPSSKDMIISGGTVRERSTPSMNVDIDPILAFIKSSGKFIQAGSILGPVSIANGGAQDRLDTLEVRYKETTFDTQQRAYKDPATGDISYQDFDTKARYEMEAQVIQGTEGAGVAPNHTAGWIKLAEIFVEAGENVSILDADIKNCTAGKDGETTANWTAETDATFRLESLSDVKTKFRAKHKEDGDHGDDVVKDQHVDWGTGAEQVDGDLIPIGTAINNTTVGDNPATTKIRAMLQKLADAVNLPIGTILMFDANRPSGGGSPGGASGAWQDNVTMFGWYACIAGNSDHGCPDMVDRFVMGKVVAGTGSIGGNNSHAITINELPSHNHGGSTGDQNVSHTHTGGSHSHNINYGPVGGSYYAIERFINKNWIVQSGMIEASNIGTLSTYTGNHAHSISAQGGGNAMDLRSANYTAIYIRKCA